MKLKKLVSLGLALALVCSNLPEMQLTVRAGETSSVSISDYETWVQADGTIEIMKYTGSETSLVVPSEIDGIKVTSIGSMAFSESGNLTSVTIPEGIKKINSYAFDGCSRLSSISISESVTTIGENAFHNCSKLTKVVIPDNVTSIGSFAFSGCSGLTEVTLPDGLLMMGTDVFGGCNAKLKLVIWPESDGENYANLEGISYRYIHDYGYRKLPDNMLELTAYTGTEKEIVIPSEIAGKKVAIIGYAFNNRTDLTSIIIPESVSEISHSAFSGCSGLKNITIPKDITFIGDWAFSGCSGLSSITLPEKITSIGNATFENCTGLTSMTIPEGVTDIGEAAFKGCSKLSKITIPESVTSIGEGAFENCNDNLALAVCPGSYAENYAVWNNISYYYAYNDNFSYTELADGTLEITGYTGSETEIIIPAELDGKKVTSIGEMAFQANNKLTKISIAEGITNIGELAFWNVRKVNEIIIPKV